jgi:hypothetical protein
MKDMYISEKRHTKMLHTSFLLGLYFGPEHGRDMFLTNAHRLLQNVWRYVPEDGKSSTAAKTPHPAQ